MHRTRHDERELKRSGIHEHLGDGESQRRAVPASADGRHRLGVVLRRDNVHRLGEHEVPEHDPSSRARAAHRRYAARHIHEVAVELRDHAHRRRVAPRPAPLLEPRRRGRAADQERLPHRARQGLARDRRHRAVPVQRRVARRHDAEVLPQPEPGGVHVDVRELLRDDRAGPGMRRENFDRRPGAGPHALTPVRPRPTLRLVHLPLAERSRRVDALRPLVAPQNDVHLRDRCPVAGRHRHSQGLCFKRLLVSDQLADTCK